MNEIPTVRISLRWHGRDIVKEVQIDPHEARCFSPLDKDHDFPGMPYAHRDAMMQRQERRALASCISQALTNAIMEEVSSNDPHNGYTPEENRAFYGNAERIHGGAGQSNQPETHTPLDGAACKPYVL